MKVKLDDFNIRVLINGLYRQGRDYDSETNAEINALLFRLVDISDTIKANRKKRIAFEPEEARLSAIALWSGETEKYRLKGKVLWTV